MIHFRQADEITMWLIAFHTRPATWWVRWFVPGRFKHVSAFGYSAKARTWVFFDPALAFSRIVVLPDGTDAETRMAEYTHDAAVLKIETRPSGVRFRPYVCCTSMIAHLIGLPGGALLPDRLWTQCLRNGASIVHELVRQPICAKADSGPCASTAAG